MKRAMWLIKQKQFSNHITPFVKKRRAGFETSFKYRKQ